jgi:hypothetical protein
MFSGTAQVYHQVCHFFFVSSVCLLVRVTVVDKNKAVVCVEETVGLPEWTAQLSVWKTTGKDSSEACAISCQNFAFYSVFPSGMTSHSKIAQFNWECIGRYTRCLQSYFINGLSVIKLCPVITLILQLKQSLWQNFIVLLNTSVILWISHHFIFQSCCHENKDRPVCCPLYITESFRTWLKL